MRLKSRRPSGWLLVVCARAIGTFSAVDRFKDGDEGRKRRMRRMDVLRMGRVRVLGGRGCTWELEGGRGCTLELEHCAGCSECMRS